MKFCISATQKNSKLDFLGCMRKHLATQKRIHPLVNHLEKCTNIVCGHTAQMRNCDIPCRKPACVYKLYKFKAFHIHLN